MVSFIILNYNTHALTLRCLESVEKQVAAEHETIVVDNGSAPGELEQLKAGLAPHKATLIVSRRNTGFGLGNMMGAQVARGEYLCFLNSDVTFSEDCITPLVDYLRQHNDVANIIPQEYNREGRPVPSFKHPFGIRHELFGDGIFERLFPRQFPSRRQFGGDTPYAVSQTSGCMMLFDAEKFWQAGGFDTNIFLYYEEYDICRRLRQRGWRCMVHPAFRFNHLHGASTPSRNPLIRRELYISKMYCYRKHHPWWQALVFQMLNVLILLVKPRKWHVLPILLRGEALSRSMRHR